MQSSKNLRRAVILVIMSLGAVLLASCTPEQIAMWQQHVQFTAQRDGTQGYRKFDTCTQAVDYIFGGRWDHARATKVVWRESTNQPWARRPGSQYAGCAQLSNAIQANFLKGPWDDPYYNVLALRDTVDHPRWGWCHWDLINYCRPGGEW